MTIDEIIFEVNEVYREIEEQMALITSKSKIKCPDFCNLCCNKNDIEASPIEFFPLAAAIYESGDIDDILIRLDESDKTGYCVLFSPDAWKEGNWACQYYNNRGLICRLFGFGYRLNREGFPELVTCKYLKENFSSAMERELKSGLESNDSIPIFRNYSMKLFSIDPDLALQQLPINKAIRVALEKMYFHYTHGLK